MDGTGNALWARIVADGVEPEESAPPPERVLSGNPVQRTWMVEERADGLYAGIWESGVGEWRIDYDEWEFFHILEGHSVLTQEGGEAHSLRPGDGFVVRPGFRGTWRTVEPTRKHFVIKV